MACDNCFNGCVETTSDKCVKYTGENYPELGIETGDSLASIELSLITYLKKALDGTGIVFTVSNSALCALVTGYLPSSGPITIIDYVTALIKSACSLQTQVTANKGRLDTIEASYTISCLSGVTASSGTHAIVQAVITKLCSTSTALTALALDVSTNYVKKSEIDDYIADYIADSPTSTAIRNRMVPNTAVEYYGSLSNFNNSGQGIGDWEQIYLCNGQNNTPDKRGRSPIGVVTGMGGGAYSPVVDPVNPNNPNYTILSPGGSNRVTLTGGQMPSHTHIATVNDPKHSHTSVDHGYQANRVNCDGDCDSFPQNTSPSYVATTESATGITVTNAPSGNNESHANVHPVLACYYIMYIPNP